MYLGPFITHLTYNVTVGARKGFWDKLLICGRLPLFPYPHKYKLLKKGTQ